MFGPNEGCEAEGFKRAWCGKYSSMDKITKNTGSLVGGIAVTSLLATILTTAFVFLAKRYSQQYKDCIAQSDITSHQCSLLYPAQR